MRPIQIIMTLILAAVAQSAALPNPQPEPEAVAARSLESAGEVLSQQYTRGGVKSLFADYSK
jgi:hypothetical protein